jgi:hypothetical protein
VDFCPAKAMQVVCIVDDGPKTDWLTAELNLIWARLKPVQVGTNLNDSNAIQTRCC